MSKTIRTEPTDRRRADRAAAAARRRARAAWDVRRSHDEPTQWGRVQLAGAA